MGKLVNAKSLRLGYNPEINWGIIYPDSGWYGYRLLRDQRLTTYIRALVREIMEKKRYNFRQIGCWFSHCYVKRKGLILELQIFIYEAEMDNFLVISGRRRRNRRGKVKMAKVKFLMYEFMRRKIKLDIQKLLGQQVSVKFIAINKKNLGSSVVGEFVVRRLYDGENVSGIFSDMKKMFDINFSQNLGERPKFKVHNIRRKLQFVKKKHDRRKMILPGKIPLKFLIRRKIYKKKWDSTGKIEGIKIMGNGMFVRKHKSMSQHLGIVSGKVPLSSIKCNIDYMNFDVMLRTSKCGIKVWLNKGEVVGKVYNNIYET